MTHALEYLREEFPGEIDLPGLLAHSPAATNGIAVLHETFSLQTRLAPRTRAVLWVVAAGAIDQPAIIEAMVARAISAGLSPREVGDLLVRDVPWRDYTRDDGQQEIRALIALVDSLVTSSNGPTPDVVESVVTTGWSIQEIIEVIVDVTSVVLMAWLVRTAEPSS
ncbi:MAG: hypothetical protein R3320_03050 [Nitriliruptorales bacterium]|nr:hypothetical protein [Nitriliruptorales bacterium]